MPQGQVSKYILLMSWYFNVTFEFNKNFVINSIAKFVKDDNKAYICVVDGNILDEVQLNENYAEIINNSTLNICDSSWIPIFINWIHGIKYTSFTGNDLFVHLLSERKYKSLFLGSTPDLLLSLKDKLKLIDTDIDGMEFISLPFCTIDEFSYKEIANNINKINPDLIWISLGAPKQEIFMSRLFPFINRGVLIAVGAVFNYHSGLVRKRRAPEIFVRLKIEWLFRVLQEPNKNYKRLFRALKMQPKLLIEEYRKKKSYEATRP